MGRALAAEALGSALLLAVIIGSGIMGERLAAGNAAIALLANAIATGCGLAVLIACWNRCRARISIRSFRWARPPRAICAGLMRWPTPRCR